MNFFLKKCKPFYFIAEIGINHNASVKIAKQLIEAAKFAGCDAVKFQKRNPKIAVPKNEWEKIRETPWGKMRYIDYKEKMEFDFETYKKLKKFCNKLKIEMIASPWDIDSVNFLEKLNVPFYKVASASITDFALLKKIKLTKKPIIISTGMSTEKEIKKCVKFLGEKNLAILHCTSTYPASASELNLNYIQKMKKLFKKSVIGYSGHETNLSSALAANILGAKIIEKHITLDRSMWGTDQKASIEALGLARLIRDLKIANESLGDGIKKVYKSELEIKKKLRLFN